MARLDLFLKNTGLIKQRAEAKRACDEGRVRVGGQPAKAGRPVSCGEIVSCELAERYIEVEVLAVPERQPSRQERARFYRLIRQERRDPHADLEF